MLWKSIAVLLAVCLLMSACSIRDDALSSSVSSIASVQSDSSVSSSAPAVSSSADETLLESTESKTEDPEILDSTPLSYEAFYAMCGYDYFPGFPSDGYQPLTMELYEEWTSPDRLELAKVYTIPDFANLQAVSLDHEQLGILTANGKAYTLGYNYDGCVGDGTNLSRHLPYELPLENVAQLYMGNTSYAVLSDGTLYGWGTNVCGQLGLGEENSPRFSLIPVPLPFDQRVAAISAGGWASYFLTETGEVYRTGSVLETFSCQMDYGATINPETGKGIDCLYDFTKMKMPEKIVALHDYGKCVAFLGESGTVYFWGILGESEWYREPTAIPFPEAITQVEIGFAYVLAVGESGTLYAWGYHSNDPTIYNADREKPMEKQLYRLLENVVDVAHIWGSTLAVTADGSCYGWGANIGGVLGLGEEAFSMRDDPTLDPGIYIPTRLDIPAVVKAVEISETNAAALTEEGYVYIWGSNTYNFRMDPDFSPEAVRDLPFSERKDGGWMMYDPVLLGSRDETIGRMQ